MYHFLHDVVDGLFCFQIDVVCGRGLLWEVCIRKIRKVFHELLSVDESMVPYFGKHRAKMYIKGKPIRFGYKIWCLCGNDGFPYHLQIYTGKGEERPTQPLGSRVVNTMVDVVEENSGVTRHKLFFDNFFTSYSLLDGLAERGMRSIGTAREIRTAGAHKVLTASKVLKKQPRGTYDYRTNGRVYFLQVE